MAKMIQKDAPNIAQQLAAYRAHLLPLALPSPSVTAFDGNKGAGTIPNGDPSPKQPSSKNQKLRDAFRDWLQWEKALAKRDQNYGNNSDETLRYALCI